MIANCDIVLASPSALFALPEAKRGVVAVAGALPRLARVIGRMRAMEMALTGRNVGADEAKAWGLCNAVSEKDGDGLVEGGVYVFPEPGSPFNQDFELHKPIILTLGMISRKQIPLVPLPKRQH